MAPDLPQPHDKAAKAVMKPKQIHFDNFDSFNFFIALLSERKD